MRVRASADIRAERQRLTRTRWVPGHLLALEIPGCENVSDSGVRYIGKNCTRLRRIDLSQCPQLTDRAVLGLKPLGKTLQEVAVAGCIQLTDRGVVALATACKSIHTIDVASCALLGDRAVSAISQLPLESVDISLCPEVTEDSVSELIAGREAVVPGATEPFRSIDTAPPPGFNKARVLKANGLPLVGDAAVRNVYETRTVFGFKRTAVCEELETVGLDSNPLVSELSVTWLAASSSRLTKVSLRDCVNIGELCFATVEL